MRVGATLFAVGVVGLVVTGCSAILGVSDVPAPAEPGPSEGGQCAQLGDPCTEIVDRIPVDPTGGCCSTVCIVTSATAGHCGSMGKYTISIDGTAGTVLGTSYQPPHGTDPGGYLAVAFSLPGVSDPDHNTYVAVDVSQVGQGCVNNQVEYGPAMDDVIDSKAVDDCGLTVTTAPPAGVTGTFNGTLIGSTKATVVFTFDQALP